MRATKVNVGKFHREEWIALCSFALSTFLQYVIVTIQGPNYSLILVNPSQNNSQIPQLVPVVIPSEIIPNAKFATTTPSPAAAAAAAAEAATNKEDISATVFGYLLSFYKFASFILTPIIGLYVEDFGVKRVYMLGLYAAALSPLLFAFLSYITWYPLFITLSFVVRGISAVAGVGMQVAIYMMITILFPGKVAVVFALMQAMQVFGVAFATPIGIWLTSIGSFSLPSSSFIVIGLLYLGFSIVVKYILPDLPAREAIPISLKNLIRAFIEFFTIPSIILLVVGVLVTGTGTDYLQTILVPNMKKYDLGFLGVGIIPLLPALLQLLSPFWGYLLDEDMSGEGIMVLGSILVTFSFVFIGPLPFIPLQENLYSTCGGLLVFGFGQGAMVVSTFALLLQQAEANDIPIDNMITITIISSIFVAATSLGGAIGPILSGIFFDQYGFRESTLFPFAMYGVVTLLMILFALFKAPKPPKSQLDEALDSEEYKETSHLLQGSDIKGDKYYHYVSESDK